MRICLFEDQGVARLEPLVLTRPAFDLICGQKSLASKQCAYFAPAEVGVMVRPHLAALVRRQQPELHVNDLTWLQAGSTVLVNARWLPPAAGTFAGADPVVALIDGEIAYAVVEPHHLNACSAEALDDCLEGLLNVLPQGQAEGRLVRHLWDLVEWNGQQLIHDFRLQRTSDFGWRQAKELALVGPPGQLVVDPTAQLDPMIVADTTRGPVVIDRDAVISAFSRLEGPCYIGPGSHVLGAKIRGGVTIGPNCRIGGEVEASIIHGHSNKYHDGFLGHSYVGEWVNFGAGTQNSDLRNDYGEVSVTVEGRPMPTGLNKVGCFVGDHTKTGLGTLINTGTSVGIFCNLLPAGQLLPKYFPSYCNWWNGALTDNINLPGLLQTAVEVMRRRDCQFTEVHAALYRHLYDQTAAERQHALTEANRPRLRRSA